jgi:hypothetical protein
MAKKKSVFERLGLIEQIDEDIEELEKQADTPESLFGAEHLVSDDEMTEIEDYDELIEEESFEQVEESDDLHQEMTETQEEVASEISLEKQSLFEALLDENDPVDEKVEENRAVENRAVETENSRSIFEVSDERFIDEDDQRQSEINREKERIEREIRQYEEMTQNLKQSVQSERLYTVAQIYENKQLDYDKKRTIFMVEEFINALPESLPIEVKRESVKNIIAASGINLEVLMDDAYKRLETLNQELNMQLNVTDDIVRQSNAAIAELESKILEIKKQISERKKGQDESKFGIDYETQKILNIVEFINPQK